MIAKEIQTILDRHYINKVQFLIHNIYCFGGKYHETDTLLVNRNGYSTDIEIKVSRSDFKADMNKVDKHSILESGKYLYKWSKDHYVDKKWVREEIEEWKDNIRPNKFYYCVPENLVTKEEVPLYAGLLYVTEGGSVREIKSAPFLHKEKIDFNPLIVNKAYYSYRELLNLKKDEEFSALKNEIKLLTKSLQEKDNQIKNWRTEYNELNSEFRKLKYDRETDN